jgi:hypothetical protein
MNCRHATLDECGNIAASDGDYLTNIKDVFAGGDARCGQSLVVWAICEGRQCARAVDLWLSGNSICPWYKPQHASVCYMLTVLLFLGDFLSGWFLGLQRKPVITGDSMEVIGLLDQHS